jgi:membrane protein implicated in regulation of membrane protease activity
VNDPVLTIALVVAAYLTAASAIVAWRWIREIQAPSRPAGKKTGKEEKHERQEKQEAAEAQKDRLRIGGFVRLVLLYAGGLLVAAAVAAAIQPVIGPLVPSVMPDDRRRVALALALGWSVVAVNAFVAWDLVRALLPPEDSGKPGPGKMGGRIGILERALVVMLTLSGGPGSIGFVIAAKTLARFKELDDQDFAERYLLGTLASVTIALASALIVQQVWLNAV